MQTSTRRPCRAACRARAAAVVVLPDAPGAAHHQDPSSPPGRARGRAARRAAPGSRRLQALGQRLRRRRGRSPRRTGSGSAIGRQRQALAQPLPVEARELARGAGGAAPRPARLQGHAAREPPRPRRRATSRRTWASWAAVNRRSWHAFRTRARGFDAELVRGQAMELERLHDRHLLGDGDEDQRGAPGSRSRARIRRALWPTGPTGTALRGHQRDLQEGEPVAGGRRVQDR